MKFEIDRSQWRFGGHEMSLSKYGETCLLNEKGNMCCLGFFSLAVGVDDRNIIDVQLPSYIQPQFSTTNEKIIDLVENEDDFVAINDNDTLSLTEREEKIKKEFKKYDIEVEFVGEYPDELKEFWEMLSS